MAKETERYNLVLPKSTKEELEAIAQAQQITLLEVIRRCIKLGIIVNNYEQQGAVFCVKKDDRVIELIIL